MPVVQKYNLPKSESELKNILDSLYSDTKDTIQNGNRPCFKGLLEIASSEATILTAIHKIKANKGSETAGVDDITMSDILKKDYRELIENIQKSFYNYKPSEVRRKYIDKPGKKEKRPLGIPTNFDKIIQECVKTIIEPILEAQFIDHSYGFRPWRNQHMATERIQQMVHKGYYWIIEGDISKFFDNVNHRILIGKLYSMGIKDQRVLMIIKAMLKAGIMGETKVNEIGTPQGGVISPLLANVYLHSLDQWITREWEEKKTRYSYKDKNKRLDALHLRSNQKPAYFVRYADDWVLITNSKENALKWKFRINKYLSSNLKLKLSDEKTLITDVRKKPIKFLGFNIKAVKGKSKRKYVTISYPDPDKLKSKVKDIYIASKKLKKFTEAPLLMHQINIVNQKIRGLIEYYETASHVNIALRKYANSLNTTSLYALKRWNSKRIPADETYNLPSVHGDYKTKIASINLFNHQVGITRLDFATWKKTKLKNPEETPYSPRGRELHIQRTGKKRALARADEVFSLHLSKLISLGLTGKLYTFEYFLNRTYAYNRDKGKCRVCGHVVTNFNVHTHHINPRLNPKVVNRVSNLATVHEQCHIHIHSNEELSHLGAKIYKKIKDFRDKLNN